MLVDLVIHQYITRATCMAAALLFCRELLTAQGLEGHMQATAAHISGHISDTEIGR